MSKPKGFVEHVVTRADIWPPATEDVRLRFTRYTHGTSQVYVQLERRNHERTMPDSGWTAFHNFTIKYEDYDAIKEVFSD